MIAGPDGVDAALAPASGVVVVDEDVAGAPIPAIWAPGWTATNWALPLVAEEVARAFVATEVVTDCAVATGDAVFSGLFVWGRNEAAPTTNRAMANPATAPAKNPPLLMPSSWLQYAGLT